MGRLLDGKVALVTGGTRGIGLAMVRALREAGAKVATVGRSSFSGSDLHFKHDLLDTRWGIVETVIDAFDRLDILVNNAGSQYFGRATEYPHSKFSENIALMLTTPFELSRVAGSYMSVNHGGHIVNILSTVAFQGGRNIVGYVAAKHGLLGVTRAMALELAPKVHVNAIAPGHIVTDMTANYTDERRQLLESITPAGRFGKPEEVAEALLYLVTSTYVYGQTVFVDGGWMAKNG